VRQHQHARGAEPIILRHDPAATPKARAENAEEITRHQTDLDLHRLAAAGVIRRLHADATDRRKRRALRLHIREFRERIAVT
jgi:hypothetical protein